jgi:hypothetical protein
LKNNINLHVYKKYIYTYLYANTNIGILIYRMWEREKETVSHGDYLLLFRCPLVVLESDSDYLKASQIPVYYWTENQGVTERKHFILSYWCLCLPSNWRHWNNSLPSGSIYAAFWPDYTLVPTGTLLYILCILSRLHCAHRCVLDICGKSMDFTWCLFSTMKNSLQICQETLSEPGWDLH